MKSSNLLKMLLATLSTYFIIFSCMGIFIATDTLNYIKNNYPSTITLLYELLLSFVIIGMLAMVIKRMDKLKLKDLGFSFIRRDAAFILIITGMTLFLCFGFVWIWSMGQGMALQVKPLTPSFIGLLAFGFLIKAMAALHEEILTRGYFMKKMNGLNPVVIILVTAILFMLIHVPLKGMELYTMLGWLFGGITYGYMFWVSRSLWIPTAAHTLHNFINDLFINNNGLSILTHANEIDGSSKSIYKLLLMITLLGVTYQFYGKAPKVNLNNDRVSLFKTS